MVERGNGHVTGEKGLEEVDVGLAECMEGLQRDRMVGGASRPQSRAQTSQRHICNPPCFC